MALLNGDEPFVRALAIVVLAAHPEADALFRPLIDDAGGAWMDQQSRWYTVAHAAEVMGPEVGAPRRDPAPAPRPPSRTAGTRRSGRPRGAQGG